MSPKHSIDYCPICGGGLCGIRICGLVPAEDRALGQPDNVDAHGLIVCDECEAIWLEPDVTTDHQYPDSEEAACPVCSAALWGEQSRWASEADIVSLDWIGMVNRDLDVNPDEELAE